MELSKAFHLWYLKTGKNNMWNFLKRFHLWYLKTGKNNMWNFLKRFHLGYLKTGKNNKWSFLNRFHLWYLKTGKNNMWNFLKRFFHWDILRQASKCSKHVRMEGNRSWKTYGVQETDIALRNRWTDGRGNEQMDEWSTAQRSVKSLNKWLSNNKNIQTNSSQGFKQSN